jgi:MinD superfamily P-loop ATPase
VTSCRDSGQGALRLENGKAVCDELLCDGCGLCSQICPVSCIALGKAEAAV